MCTVFFRLDGKKINIKFECIHILPFSANDDVHLMAGNIFQFTLKLKMCEGIVSYCHICPCQCSTVPLWRYCLVSAALYLLRWRRRQQSRTIFCMCCLYALDCRTDKKPPGLVGKGCDVIMMWRMLENDAWFYFMQKQYKILGVSLATDVYFQTRKCIWNELWYWFCWEKPVVNVCTLVENRCWLRPSIHHTCTPPESHPNGGSFGFFSTHYKYYYSTDIFLTVYVSVWQ